MGLLRNGRAIALLGVAAALMAGIGVAWLFLSRSPKSTEAPPAAQGGLVVVTGRDDDQKLDPRRPLRCFVGGQFVGELPLEVCAQRNGVATGALDVGLDASGALAASNSAAAGITPLPPQPALSQPLTEQSGATNATNEAAADESASQDLCWRYGAGGWTQLDSAATLSACVQSVYGARCPASGQAFYGRWGSQTLRLQDGRVEISADNSIFQSLIDAWPACQTRVGVNAPRSTLPHPVSSRP